MRTTLCGFVGVLLILGRSVHNESISSALPGSRNRCRTHAVTGSEIIRASISKFCRLTGGRSISTRAWVFSRGTHGADVHLSRYDLANFLVLVFP
jgi:hypothetical protein